MKLGTENRTKVIVAGVLLLLAVVLLGQFVFSGSSPQPVAAAPATTPAVPAPRPANTRPGKKGPAPLVSSLDPRLQEDWLKASEDTKYEGRNRNIFVSIDAMPTPVGDGSTDHHRAKITPQPPPTPPPYVPPPINLKFYGFTSNHGQNKQVFLTEGDDIFIAKEGDIIDRRYKILRISPTSVEVEDVLNNNRQQIPLTQGG